MGRVRNYAAQLLHLGRSPQPSALAGLVGATHALAQPVLHQSNVGHQEPSTGHHGRKTSPPRPPVAEHSTAKIDIPDNPPPYSLDGSQPHCQRPSNDHGEPTGRDPNIWARAFQHFMESRPELATYYAQHLHTLGDTSTTPETPKETAPNSPPTTLQTIGLIVKKLHHHREQRQWTVPLAGKDIKIREQAEKFAKFLLWSDPIVKDALSAQPYAALAWSGVSFLLSVSAPKFHTPAPPPNPMDP
ncbi:hypothetical protein B0H63DRAFT_194670 [Podospora didyma]|uniref:NWD NACHT-NTPase N-terminal domain-containing protein n=1 Tax=Podospora didyma TaxID=330526 RepID=A0AAE0NG90_9PEZI|nr:hypothetical protein B0H63DRAFT_194670 [Podospora didyma]